MDRPYLSPRWGSPAFFTRSRGGVLRTCPWLPSVAPSVRARPWLPSVAPSVRAHLRLPSVAPSVRARLRRERRNPWTTQTTGGGPEGRQKWIAHERAAQETHSMPKAYVDPFLTRRLAPC